MRALLIFAAAAAALLVGSQPGHAYVGNGPWCAVVNTGLNNVVWQCTFASIETCRQEVIAGNRGFCNPNPRWQGASKQTRKHKRHHAPPQ